jgi:hypothetical protein
MSPYGRLNPHRNAFRVCFMLAMFVKGVIYGVFGLRISATHQGVENWEQICGVLLLLSTITILMGLFWRGDSNVGVLVSRWGYVTFAVAEGIFAVGSFTAGFWDGLASFLVNGLFALGAAHSAWEVDKVIAWRMGHTR